MDLATYRRLHRRHVAALRAAFINSNAGASTRRSWAHRGRHWATNYPAYTSSHSG